MPPAHCPKCSMLLAQGVVRCRYCGNALTETFWSENSERVASPQPLPIKKPIKTPIKKPAPKLTGSLKAPAKKLIEPQGQNGFQPPTVGWPAKAIGIGILLALAALIFVGENEGEQIATDCRSQCFAKEKQHANPPKHFMSGCMQACMKP